MFTLFIHLFQHWLISVMSTIISSVISNSCLTVLWRIFPSTLMDRYGSKERSDKKKKKDFPTDLMSAGYSTMTHFFIRIPTSTGGNLCSLKITAFLELDVINHHLLMNSFSLSAVLCTFLNLCNWRLKMSHFSRKCLSNISFKEVLLYQE